jgi:hypothetical protein
LSLGISRRRLCELRGRRKERRTEFAGLAWFTVTTDAVVQKEFAARDEELFVVGRSGQRVLQLRGMAADGSVYRGVEESSHPWGWRDIRASLDQACFEKQQGEQGQDERSDREALEEGLHMRFSDALAWRLDARMEVS